MVRIRGYDHERDYALIDRFLVEGYEPGAVLANWLQPRWEYMHHHPFILGQPRERFGIAEEAGEVLGVVHFEHRPVAAYFQVRPGRDDVEPALLAHALSHLGGYSPGEGRRVLECYAADFDATLGPLLLAHGFERRVEGSEPHSRYRLDRPVPPAELPAGFRLQSLAEGNDLQEINRVLWRGFDHPGPPPDSEIAGRRLMQSAPNYRRDLTIVAVAPNGHYAAYAGMWLVPENRVAYLEPVATDPDYRRMGLGRAAVLEGLRRVAALGAAVAWVGSAQPFYLAMGFEEAFTADRWVRALD